MAPLPPNRKKPAGKDPELIRDRSRGALLGLAVGDALGTTLEFKPISAPPFPQRATGPHRDIIGGGPFRVRPGQVTDDTQMAVALAQSLRAVKRYSAEDVLSRYRAWMPHAFDVGAQTRAALANAPPLTSPFLNALNHWLQNAKKPAGNGALMRTAPIGVYLHADRDARMKASLEDSALTHTDPRCQLSCAVFNAVIAAAITTAGPITPKKLVAGALPELTLAAAMLGRMLPQHLREVQEASAIVRADLEAAERPDPQLYGPELHLQQQQGFVRVAFRLAFWELFHASSFEDALVDVVNRGGDADTNGAICGALLGSVYGESQIPLPWRTAVLEAAPTQQVFRDVYHPREFLPLVG